MTIMNTGTIPTVHAGFFLRAARESAGLTQQELADKLQVDRTTIRDNENGIRKPRNERVIAWALACGVKPGWLQWHVDLALDGSVALDLDPARTDAQPDGYESEAEIVNQPLTADRRAADERSKWVLAA